MPSTTNKRKEEMSLSHLILNLSLSLIWGIIGSLIIIWKVSIQSSSVLVGILLGFTTTLLIISPFIYHHNHKKILSYEETDPNEQVLASIKFVGLLILITAASSILFAFLHQQFMVVLK